LRSLQEHIDHTNLFYKNSIEKCSKERNIPLIDIDGGKTIHSWVDYSVRDKSASHRVDRHNLETTLPKIKEYFGSIYGKELAEDIYRDHLSADAISERGLGNITRDDNDTTTIAITIGLWRKINKLRRNPRELQNDILLEAILLLEEKRRLENGI
jgi:hypothetical protein